MTAYVPQISIDQVAPFLILAVAALLVLALDALLDILVKGITRERRDMVLAIVAGAALVVTGFTFYVDVLGATGRPFFEGALRADEFGNLGALTILFSALVFLIMAPRFVKKYTLPAGELYALLLFAVFGMTMLAVANELITAFICIEILSLSLYVMAGINRRSPKAIEASFKYFILGAFASAFLVLGIAFIFGATGTTQMFGENSVMESLQAQRAAGQVVQLPSDVATYNLGINDVLYAGERLANAVVPAASVVDGQVLATPNPELVSLPINPMWVYLGFTLMLVGIGFKLSLAPFHMWAPDVYEGAPTITAMFIATASKVAAFAFLVHFVEAMSFWRYFPVGTSFVIGAIALISMLWGNLAALVQTNIKRMLAYSSVAHGGYMAVGVTTLLTQSVFSDPLRQADVRNSIILYLFAYTLMNVVAFGIVAYLGKEGESDIANYRGLSKRRPGLAAAMAITMISLTGIPPTVGFAGKFFIFKEAISAGLIELAVVAMIASAISAFYYLRVVVAMYMQDEEEEATIAGGVLQTAGGYQFVVGLSTTMIFVFGILPALFLALGR
ncbi:NADH-quinone oxidoreductase subunit N [bacterium]|nr:NADH-quinone oxidoreductase subunit N [bacterium]